MPSQEDFLVLAKLGHFVIFIKGIFYVQHIVSGPFDNVTAIAFPQLAV